MKEMKNKKSSWLLRILPSKRKLIQLYAALLFNANLKGFKTGRIYTGKLKNFCTPGLNCYSCPGASAACPLGALQNALASSGTRAPYYVIGIIMLWGLLLGRWICGFLCPFGLIQELLHKIKTPKVRKSRITRVISYLKYVIFAFFVMYIPLVYAAQKFPLPAFCKYICPSGTLLGAMGLLSNSNNDGLFRMLGALFTWKFCLLVAIVLLCVFFYRAFCRFLCPLGLVYGFFNKISFVGVKVDKPKCTECGICVDHCKMDIRRVGDIECINCGECIPVCPTKAIEWKGKAGAILLSPNSIEGASIKDDQNISVEGCSSDPAKIEKRNKTIRWISGILAALVLCGALVYYNFIDGKEVIPPDQSSESESESTEESESGEPGPSVKEGNKIGDLCYSYEMSVYGENAEYGDSISILNTRGKATVINFWGTWCTPCVQELPHFEKIAKEYEDNVVVIAVHSSYRDTDVMEYINSQFAGYSLIFTQDGEASDYYEMLGGSDTYPMTVVLDKDGIIVESIQGSITYEELSELVETAMGR